MLLILLYAAWLATTVMVVGLCRMAAHGDAQPAPGADRHPRRTSEGLPIWEDQPGLVLQNGQ
jgi:hypothetical protein